MIGEGVQARARACRKSVFFSWTLRAEPTYLECRSGPGVCNSGRCRHRLAPSLVSSCRVGLDVVYAYQDTTLAGTWHAILRTRIRVLVRVRCRAFVISVERARRLSLLSRIASFLQKRRVDAGPTCHPAITVRDGCGSKQDKRR
jgi:hypothetical protein